MYNRGQEIETLEGWIKKNPNSIAFAHLADCYLQTEDVDRAIRVCEQGLQKHPDYPSAYFVLAKCYLAKRQYEEAEKRLKKALMLDPKFLRAHRRYGDLMQEIGWNKSSEMSYKRVLEIDPLDEDTRMQMGNLRNQEIETAEDLVDESALTEPEPMFDDSETFSDDTFPTQSDLVEEVMQEQIEAEEDFDFAEDEPSDFEEEEERFTTILDDIFGSKMAEEESQAEDARRTIERAAKLEKEKRKGAARVDVIPTSTPEELEKHPIFTPNQDQQVQTPTTIPPVFEPDESVSEEPDTKKTSNISKNLYSFQSDETKSFGDIKPEETSPHSTFEMEADTDDEEFFGFENELTDRFDKDQIRGLEDEDEEDTPWYYETPKVKKGQQLSGQEFDETPNLVDYKDDTAEEELAFGSILDDMQESRPDTPPETERDDWHQRETGSKPLSEDMDAFPKTPFQPEPKQDEKEKIVTPTLGEIFAAQGQYAKAISVFENLYKKDPTNEIYLRKIAELKRKMEEESK